MGDFPETGCQVCSGKASSRGFDWLMAKKYNILTAPLITSIDEVKITE